MPLYNFHFKLKAMVGSRSNYGITFIYGKNRAMRLQSSRTSNLHNELVI